MCASKVSLRPSEMDRWPLGFEAPMFFPIRTDPKRPIAARSGTCSIVFASHSAEVGVVAVSFHRRCSKSKALGD